MKVYYMTEVKEKDGRKRRLVHQNSMVMSCLPGKFEETLEKIKDEIDYKRTKANL